MNQKSSLRENPQFVSTALTAPLNADGDRTLRLALDQIGMIHQPFGARCFYMLIGFFAWNARQASPAP
jgi:hypothetical protein